MDMFSGVATASLASPPQWELGIATRDQNLRGAAGRAFLAAYLQRCRGGVADPAGERGTRAHRDRTRMDRGEKRTA
jgi:hypothetical protein